MKLATLDELRELGLNQIQANNLLKNLKND